MITYTGLRNLFGSLTNNTASANLTLGDTLNNNSIQKILGKRAWPFLDAEVTTTTTANQAYVEVPARIKKVKTVRVQQGTTNYHPKEAPNRQFWDNLNSVTSSSYTSDAPEWFYHSDGRVYIWPTPAT